VIHAAFRVSGHIDDMNIGLQVLDLAGKLGSAKLGHDDVGEENIGWRRHARWCAEIVRGKAGPWIWAAKMPLIARRNQLAR
jgi:hypothetical protein